MYEQSRKGSTGDENRLGQPEPYLLQHFSAIPNLRQR
jgi:hypothetical protein